MYVANVHLQLIAPSTVFGPIIMPRRKPNAELRPREYLTEAEVERLRKAACAGNRNGDETMILIALWAEAFEQFGIPKGHTGPAEEMFEAVNAGWMELGVEGTEHVAGTTSARDVFAAAQKAVTA